MPDLAVEVLSPSNSLPELRRKAENYLRHGTALVWLVKMDDKTVDGAWTREDEERNSRPDGALDGRARLARLQAGA